MLSLPLLAYTIDAIAALRGKPSSLRTLGRFARRTAGAQSEHESRLMTRVRARARA